jgi:lipopolysaccharide/colanic/teichoic acid biosynthesis glycosyltransferase
MKKILDYIVILTCLPILLVMLILITITNKIFLGGNVFFLQQRPGLKGKLFNLVKFRTMTNECDEYGNLLPDSLRLTRYGNFLRKTSLDELPEIINVLKGDMSLVGPRPLLVEYLPLYSESQMRRHDVLPGITGWAQVNGRNSVSWNDKFEMDLWYIENRSTILDMKILAKTFVNVLTAKDINANCHTTMPKFLGNKDDVTC